MTIRYYTISNEARSLILLQSKSCFPDETGGLLAGKLTSDCVHIEHAIKAGPKATSAPNRFRRDGNYSQGELDAIARESNGKFDYVGEWHSHPMPSLLSSTDIRSMRWIASDSNYATVSPVLLLCVRSRKRKWQLYCYCFNKQSITRLTWIDCEGKELDV